MLTIFYERFIFRRTVILQADFIGDR